MCCLTANLWGFFQRAIFDFLAKGFYSLRSICLTRLLKVRLSHQGGHATAAVSGLLLKGIPRSSSNLSPSLSVGAVVTMAICSPRMRSMEL